MADHPLRSDMEVMWHGGERARSINQLLQENGYPPLPASTINGYGARHWRTQPPGYRTPAPAAKTAPTHLVIPDTQVKPGVPTDHLRWIGQYILDRKPDVIVHLGDHWDMPSLSSYDRGKKAMEGRRYVEDVRAGNEAFALLDIPTATHNARLKPGEAPYSPRKVLLRGNHEDRITRAAQDNAQLEGAVTLDDLNSPGWEVYDFLVPVEIDGVTYAHYFYNHNTGRALGGMVATRLKTLGFSFTQGHQQGLDIAMRPVGRRMQYGLVAGSCYLAEEDYRGPQAQAHWRGVVMKHEVSEGSYDPMLVSLSYLCLRYEGVPLNVFLRESYGNQFGFLDQWC